MHLSRSQLGCESSSQIVPDHAAFDREAKGCSCSVARFFETASKRARAHSGLFVVKDISGSTAIDYLLQSCAYRTIHRNQAVAGTFALRLHQKKPIRSYFYVSTVGWPKHRQAAEVYVFNFQLQQLRMFSDAGSKRDFDRYSQVCQAWFCENINPLLSDDRPY